jgi:hypothetical protein
MTCTICDQTFDETTMCLVKYNPGDSERMGYFTAHLECCFNPCFLGSVFLGAPAFHLLVLRVLGPNS